MAEVVLKSVLLIGGGGNLGPAILRALDAEAKFNTSILARHSSTSTYPAHVPVIKIDDSYPEQQLLEAFKGQDAIICALSLQNIHQQIKFIDVAVKAGVKHFVPAEFGGNKEASELGEKIPLHDQKHMVLERLLKAESEGLSWTAVATGPFIDWGALNGFLGFDIKTRHAKIYGTGDERWTGTKVDTIGLAVARLLERPSQVKDRFIYIYSVSTTQNEILSAFESITDTQWSTQHLKWEEEIPAGRRLLESGHRAGVVPLILSYFFRQGMGADYAKDVKADNELLGLPDETVVGLLQDLFS